MREITTKLYQFDELPDDAKEHAREWWRNLEAQDCDLSAVLEDFEQIADLIGLELKTHSVKPYGGGTRQEANIYFSGFSSQGDGACFEGFYQYAKGAARKLKEYAPQDTELARIADGLQELQRRNRYQITASCSHSGHYYHARSMSVDVERADEKALTAGAEEEMTELLRDLADWLYHQLEREYEYRRSDENVDESIRINEYEFTKEGRRA